MDPDVEFAYGGRAGNVSGVMVEVKRQIERGATIVNLSVGPSTPHAAFAGNAAMWRRFLGKMQEKHPEILFVAAAGNETGVLDGHNYGPGGVAAPNLITVGSVQTDGSLTSYSNVADPSSPDGEVSIHAPGDQAVWGTGADGTVRNRNGGTSSATPMVTAAAALIRSVDPTLKAADIKALLERSAQATAGGGVLRVDAALREAVDTVRARNGAAALTDDEIRGAACSIEVTEEQAGREPTPPALRWNLTARLPRLAVPTTVTLTAGGARPTNWRQPVRTAADAAAWSVLAPVDGVVEVVITRLDNGYWRVFRLWGSPLPTPTPEPTPTPTPTPEPTPAPTPPPPPPADPGFDCSKPPSGEIARLNWSLHCQQIAP
jgi:subtilisin family serine protease